MVASALEESERHLGRIDDHAPATAGKAGELDGVAWCGFTEAYEVGWADVCKYALGNSITGAWFGSYFANTPSWNKVPPHLQELFRVTIAAGPHRATFELQAGSVVNPFNLALLGQFRCPSGL